MGVCGAWPAQAPRALRHPTAGATFQTALLQGGSDFDPKGKSDAELQRFCQSFMVRVCGDVACVTHRRAVYSLLLMRAQPCTHTCGLSSAATPVPLPSGLS